MIFGSNTRSDCTFKVCQRIACRIIEISCGIAVPLPIANRNHTSHIQPTERTEFQIQFHSHMLGIHACHIQHKPVVRSICRRIITSLGCSLIQPFSEISIQISTENPAFEAISYFCREYFFINGIRIRFITCGTIQECSS